MAPADIRKEGSSYDLPLAIGILAAAEQIDSSNLSKFVLMGELSMDGSLQPIKGALPIAIKAREEGFKGFILPKQNVCEAAVVNDLEVYGASNIKEVLEFMEGNLHCGLRLLIPVRSFTTASNCLIAISPMSGDKRT